MADALALIAVYILSVGVPGDSIMPDREDKDVHSLGMTRRDLLRRGAIVGGGLLWATPTIQSFATPAYAQYPSCRSCCRCAQENEFGQTCGLDSFSREECERFCSTPPGNFVVAYETGENCTCDSVDGCDCTGEPCEPR
jgi:hypothetical protein